MSNVAIKVSVILPVYNVEQYIEKCLNSLRSQTLNEMEFIFVDDKSPDKSISIVESAANEDTRIRILYNDYNLGPGPSRNRGIEIARGEYLNFSDPDDYMDDDFFETLYNLAKEKDADVVKGHVTAVDSKGEKVDSWPDASKHFTKNFSKSKALFWCNQWENFSELFRRDFIINNPKLRFTETRVGEDSVFLNRVNLKNPSIYLSNDTEYYHLIRDNSLEGNISCESCFEGLKALRDRIDVFKEYDYPKGTEEYIRSTVRYYIRRFLELDSAQKNGIKEKRMRRLYKKELDAALSKMPNPDNITNDLKEYEDLETKLYKNKKQQRKSKNEQSLRSVGSIRIIARKVLPESSRKAILRILEKVKTNDD